MGIHRVEETIGGRRFVFETGRMAKQASGSVLATCGESVVLAAAVMAEPRPGLAEDFVSMTVDYRERTFSAGKFPGGFFKREGRPTLRETLTMRLIDRPLRPLFPEGFANDLQIATTCLSFDQENDPDVLAVNAASAALAVSGIPFAGPIGAVRVGKIGSTLVLNPTVDEVDQCELELVVAGTADHIIMVEGGAREVPEDIVIDAIAFAQDPIRKLVEMQVRLRELAAPAPLPIVQHPSAQAVVERLRGMAVEPLKAVFFTPGKHARAKAIKEVRARVIDQLVGADVVAGKAPPDPAKPTVAQVKSAFAKIEKEVSRAFALEGRRADGRGMTDIRPISIETGILPRVHGSALFTRGETQALVNVTLGTAEDEQTVDGILEEYSKRFMLHYNFPPFSVGEIKPMRGPGRREYGHGMLAERALEPVLPAADDFPYTIRIVSDILESNGSSSMASVCGGTLSLLDAGVKIKAPVAGIAMGLIQEGDRVAVLSDILGSEDHFGDMDFKVAGTEQGVTAVQMDIKTAGISVEVMRKAMAQAREGRLRILQIMREAVPFARPNISPYAPKILRLRIPVDKIGTLIGPGGKMINRIQTETGATIEVDDDGLVVISSTDLALAERAQEWVRSLVEELQVGRIYRSKVVTIKEYGCFVKILPGEQEGLVHVSELSDKYVDRVEDVVQVGMDLEVKLLLIDEQGRYKFSAKAAKMEREGRTPPSAPPEGASDGSLSAPPGAGSGRPPRRDGGGGRGGDGRRHGGDRDGGRGGRSGRGGGGGGRGDRSRHFGGRGGDRQPRPHGSGGAPDGGSPPPAPPAAPNAAP